MAASSVKADYEALCALEADISYLRSVDELLEWDSEVLFFC